MKITWPFETCDVCRTQVKPEYRGRYSLSGFKFTELEGTPYVCEKCIAKALGLNANWRSKVVDFLEAQ